MSGSGFAVPGRVAPLASAQRRAVATGRPQAAGEPSRREEVRLVISVVGAMAIVFLPAAQIVVGSPTPAFFGFAVAVMIDWGIGVSMQVAILRGLRSHARTSRLPATVQFLAIAGASIAYKIIVDPVVGPFTERAGLGGGDDWRFVVGAWTSVLVALYLVVDREGRSRHALAARRLADIQRAQVRARREIVDAQLRAMQARVDPQFFFDTLDAVEALYRHDVARAEALFDELVVFLRTALPHVDASSSVLARELELARSCTRIDSLASGRERRLDADVPGELMRLPFPAGVVLPLLHGALAAACDRSDVAVAVHARAARDCGGGPAMRLVVTTPRPPSAAVCGQVRESLRALYGDAASLCVSEVASDRFDLVVGIPHDEP